ncbi:hypothetical protein GPJ56_010122 [Histomonas meleagridis]|uniref:uncharacterized protein n=1 Tax=Histomonas meleagridis TaxID=135588 RepID=UPI00355A74F0|nr:hypothetical protein GPJ56_010122 [Histomonas meleagridis]KAH0806779.1 hypothetical protein GO595_000422 [Histomonas meleagridis]
MSLEKENIANYTAQILNAKSQEEIDKIVAKAQSQNEEMKSNGDDSKDNTNTAVAIAVPVPIAIIAVAAVVIVLVAIKNKISVFFSVNLLTLLCRYALGFRNEKWCFDFEA